MKLVSICLIAAATSNAANAFSQHAFFTKPSASFFLTTNTRCRGSTKDDDCSNQSMQDDRRAFLLASTAALASGIVTSFPSQSSAATVDYKAVAADISDLVIKNPDWGPTLVRLAWHSSGTYDKMKNDGGSRGGTIRFKEELAHGANAGLAAPALEWLEPVHAKYEGLSYADLYTLAGGTSCFFFKYCK